MDQTHKEDAGAVASARSLERSNEGLTMDQRRGLCALEPGALAAFFDVYFDRIYGYVRRLVRDEHLAEDLTQDIFLHIHRAFGTYDPSRALRPWVFTIATNKLRDYWRSKSHRDVQSEESLERDGMGETLVSEQASANRQLSDREMDERLRGAIDELSDGMRMTVLLRVYEELSFEAIGEIVGRSEVAVRKRYSRALEALRDALGGAWKLHTEGT